MSAWILFFGTLTAISLLGAVGCALEEWRERKTVGKR